MKVMTFNTQHCLNYLKQKIDYDIMAKAILDLGADVVGLNEMRGAGVSEQYGAQVAILAEKTNIFPSKSEARKMITANGFSINKQKFTDPQKAITADMLLNGKYLLCQKGKKNYYIIEIKD